MEVQETPSETGKVYKYQVWDGIRHFWCKGKVQTGPSTKNLIIVIALINGINALSLGFSWVVSTIVLL